MIINTKYLFKYSRLTIIIIYQSKNLYDPLYETIFEYFKYTIYNKKCINQKDISIY